MVQGVLLDIGGVIAVGQALLPGRSPPSTAYAAPACRFG
jgi:hypothetical protein